MSCSNVEYTQETMTIRPEKGDVCAFVYTEQRAVKVRCSGAELVSPLTLCDQPTLVSFLVRHEIKKTPSDYLL